MEKLFNALSEQGKYTKSFEDFQTQFGSAEGQEKLYGALKESGDYTKSFDNFSNQFFIAEPVKTNDSASADPAVESVNVDMGSNLENGSSELPNEKNTWLENFFGEEEDAEDKLFGAVDFVSDLWRSGKGGWAVGASVDESFDLFKSEGGMSEEDAAALVEAGRNVESYGSTNEQIAASNKMKKLQEEGYSGVGAFITAYWENPSALASTMASSLAMMASSFFDSEEVRYSAAAGSGAGAATGAAGGAGVGAVFGGIGAVPGAIIGAKLGAVSGAMSGITAAMETGLTTAQLLEEQAISTGLDWGVMTDKQRINFVMSLTKNKDQFDDLKNKALARGLTIGGVDFVVNMATFGVGKLVSGRIAGSAASALTKPATGLAAGATESIGSGVGEYLGQKAAGQEFNFEEIALEALADKQATVISAVKNIRKGNPSYKLNGEKMNGKQFSEALKIMDDVAIVKADIKIEDSPSVQKIVDNRRGNIAADQRVDSRISDVADRAEAIRLTKEKNKLEGNKEGNKTKLAQINGELEVISDKYADSEVDATIQERQDAVAQAADTKFETEFNKNYKALKDKQKETGVEPVIFEDDNLFAETAAKDLNVTKEYILKEAPEGVFVGGGKVYINKNQAKRSINIATGNIGAISVASHEVLHPIFNALIGGAKAQGQFVNQFKKQMTSKQRAYVNKRLKSAYKDQPGAEAIELMNIFSDGIIKNEINYDQTTFEKLGSTIVDFFRSQLGLTTNEISFDDGRSVFNFLKEYNTSIKAGKLSDKAISAIKAAETKNKTTVAKAGILQEEQFSKTIAEAEAALQEAQDADPNDPRYFDNLDKAEAALDAAEEAAKNPQAPAPKVKTEDKPKPKPKVNRPEKPTRTTDLSPRDPKSKKIMDTYNEGMEGVERTEYKSNKPLPASLERKLVPLFEGYINTIVQQKFKQFATEALEFQDALSILRAEVISALRTYNPSKNKDLAGYVKKIVQTRQSLMFKEANTEFTSNLDDAKGVTNTTDVQTIDRSGTVERGQATFEELDIVDDTLIKDIKSDLEKEIRARVQKGTLSETVAVKKGRETYLVTWLEDYVNKQLFKKLSKRLGAIGEKNGQTFIPGAYIDFLNDPKTFDIITKALPIKSIKKSYNKLFPTERVGRELTAEGNPIFRIKKIDKKAFLTYFVEGKKSTILERQKQLFREILEPLAKQIVADYATPENIAALKPIQALAPAESIDVVENIVIDAQLNNLESKLDRYKGEQAGFDIIQFSKEATGKFDRKEITSVKVRKALNLNEHSEEFLSLPESLQMATNWVRESLQLKGATIGGLIYEILTIGRVDANAKDLNLNIKVKTLKGEVDFDSNRPDIQLSIKKDGQTKDINYELKQSAIARCGQTTLRADFNNDEVFSVSSKRKNIAGDKVKMNFADMPTGRQLKLSLKSVQKDLRQILDIINKIDGSNINTIPMGGTMSIEAVNAVKKSEAYKRIAKVETGADGQTVSNHYNAKDTHLFQIGGIGTLLMGPDIYGLNNNDLTPVQNLTDVKFKGNLRIKFNYRYKNKKRIGASISLISEPIIANPKNLSKSPINLDTKQGTAALYDRLQFSKTAQPSLTQFSKTVNKAKAMINRPNAPVKGISVWDFDDTLATTKSNVLYTLPDGTKGKINATEFALQADNLEKQGAEFDFSEFSKVMKGAKGPMFDKAIARNKKFGNSNVYILTARPADSKYAIHEFLKGIGLDIKLENIFGLGDGTAIAKAKWVIGKVAEGYNDFYFADDAYKNVKAVQEVLEQADVKSKVHQAKVQFSKNLNKDFNNIIQDATGIEAAKDISTAKSKILAKKKGRFKFFIPPSADDFAGLLYKLTGKGTKGEQQQAWFKQALFDPFARGMREFESYKQNVTAIVNQLKKDIKNVPAKLKKVNETGFTNENAVRVYLWDKNGFKIDGLNKEDIQELISIVENDKNLLDFADQMDAVLNGYPEPQNDWLAGTITTDAINMINTSKRAEFLQEWQTNADAIFSKENLNKLRAAFGENYVEALQDMLYRMKTGRNRPSGANKLTNQFMNWVNDSVGTIMFFNTRSALLQTLSTVNFINWGDNNPIAAAKAFSNQKQFWSDFAMLFNSDFLKQRRSGLKNDVNADDIANAAETATNKTKAVLSSLLKVGFLPTQIADSFAIALGGASFVRNRINKYVSEGLTKQAAEEQAFLDFQEIAEETQQSSRPDRISQQQASPLGRIILAFANTPMQYMRLTKKAFLDLKNGRGDAKTNITKIAYYMAVQNIIFSSLQAALFASLFEDDDEELNNKQIRVANSMLDSILRGVGIYGAIGSTLKNIIIEIKRQSEKDRPDYTVAAQRALSISPPIDSKMRKLMGAARTFSYKTTREKMVGYGLDNPAYYAAGQVVSATTNIPLDRAIRKADNIRVAMDNDTKYWQSVALMLGYSQWDVGLVETSKNKKNKTGFGKTTSWKKSEWKK